MKMTPALLIGTCFLLFSGFASPLHADVSPGDVIDRSNWEKVQGLLPDPVVEWVKNGDVLHIAELNFDPDEFWPPAATRSLEANAGKYDVDPEGMIIDPRTGQLPQYIEGLPFPRIEPGDSRAGTKIMHNKTYYTYCLGNVRFPFYAIWVGRESGFEREVRCEWLQYPMDGFPDAREQRNPDGIERYSIIRVIEPFDIAGTNILTWRYRDKRPDSTFGYIPAIRRVRRMSPANRSDAFIGSDACVDDAWTFDGKVASVDWKVLREQEALLPFVHSEPQSLEKNARGEWQTPKSIKPIVFGYQKPGYTGAPWFPTNVIWAKRRVYVIEMTPKDPYYNYGTQYMWVDKGNFWCSFKVIHDRAGKYWKTFWTSQAHFQSPDQKLRLVTIGTQMSVDDRTRHCTIIEDCSPRNQWVWFAVQDVNDYTLAGFQKLCK